VYNPAPHPVQNNNNNFDVELNKLMEEGKRRLEQLQLNEEDHYNLSQMENSKYIFCFNLTEKQRHEKGSSGEGIMGNITSFWRSSKTESVEFLEHIKLKSLQFDVVKEKFTKSLQTFDKNQQKSTLLVYIHSIVNKNNFNNFLIKNIFNNPELASFINSNFQFYPILSNSKSLSKLEAHYKKKDVPCLLFLRWDFRNQLTLIKKTNFDQYSTPDLVYEEASLAIDFADQMKNGENSIFAEIDRKKEALKRAERENQIKIDNFFNNPQPQLQPQP
jgi:hypothetical protein